MSELLKEWEVSCVLRQGWLVQPCRERGKDECRKHDLLEQNEYGDPLLTQGMSALPLSLFMAIQTSQVGWWFLLEQQCSLPILGSGDELL